MWATAAYSAISAKFLLRNYYGQNFDYHTAQPLIFIGTICSFQLSLPKSSSKHFINKSFPTVLTTSIGPIILIDLQHISTQKSQWYSYMIRAAIICTIHSGKSTIWNSDPMHSSWCRHCKQTKRKPPWSIHTLICERQSVDFLEN